MAKRKRKPKTAARGEDGEEGRISRSAVDVAAVVAAAGAPEKRKKRKRAEPAEGPSDEPAEDHWQDSDARRPRAEFSVTLPVRLSPEAALAKGDELAAALVRLDENAAQRAHVVGELAQERKAIQKEARALRDAFVNRVEKRPVPCREEADWAAKTLTIIRLDTEEVVLKRDMRGAELQAAMEFPEGTADTVALAEATAPTPA